METDIKNLKNPKSIQENEGQRFINGFDSSDAMVARAKKEAKKDDGDDGKDSRKKSSGTIVLTLPDGSTKSVAQGTTGMQVAESIGQRLAQAALACTLDGALYDLSRSLPHGGAFSVITFASPGGEGVDVFRHSTAHIFAYAIQELYPGAKNTIGPAVDEGFYYDFDDLHITPDDFQKIEAKMQEIVKKNIPFERTEITLAEAKKLFAKNPYKLEMASEFAVEGQKLSAYKIGSGFIDLCRGPHVPSTGMIKAFKLTTIAGAYWRADAKNKQLTRVYGISFPEQKMLDAHLKQIEEAEKRDHRKIGQELELVMFHEWSPGSPFYLPKGTIMYNELQRFFREEYVKRGYQEVITPVMFNKALWETSGHWQHYKENMFLFKVDNEEFSLKPMNCPGHVLMYKSKSRSYNDLPLRIADFGVLHRNELKGVLGGLTRTRKLEQDDAHIFCAQEQIPEEVAQLLDFVKYIYTDVFKFPFTAKLSTRPVDFMGEPSLWDGAERALADSLKKNKISYVVKPGEGAFYGPKIDFDVKDAIGRDWQLATIQLDFQLPRRFDATYDGADNKKHHAVMIHRAILGSLGRFMGVLIEHYAGKFPLWLSPEQVRVLTITDRQNRYADAVVQQIRDAGLRAECDIRNETLNKKIREAQLAQVNYIVVLGDKEEKSTTVNVRTRDEKIIGEKKLPDFVEMLKKEIKEKK